MPEYMFKCTACGHTHERVDRMKDAKYSMCCEKCGKKSIRDYKAEQAGVVTDEDYTQHDRDRYELLKAGNKVVHRPVLSKALARVPGIPKTKGRDGKQYAIFRNKQHRRAVLKHIGAVDLDG